MRASLKVWLWLGDSAGQLFIGAKFEFAENVQLKKQLQRCGKNIIMQKNEILWFQHAAPVELQYYFRDKLNIDSKPIH